MDVAVKSVDIFALACEDGTVSVRQMVVKDQFNDSFVYDDVANPVFTSDTCLFQHHSENRPLSHISYTGRGIDEYVTVGGPTVFAGSSDHEITLPADVTQLRCFATPDLHVMVAAGLGSIGEVHILDAHNLTRQFVVRSPSISTFNDF